MITTWDEVYAYICGLVKAKDYEEETCIIFGDDKPLLEYSNGALKSVNEED